MTYSIKDFIFMKMQLRIANSTEGIILASTILHKL